MRNLKALFIRTKLLDLTEFLLSNNINYQKWENELDGEQEIRIDIDDLSDEKSIILFEHLGSKYKQNILNIIEDYDYLIFWW